jgi:putative transcriptional regulator
MANTCGIVGAHQRHHVDQQPQMRNTLPELRAQRGMTQADLADALNVSRQTVNALETGRYDPSLPLAFAIAKLFKCKIEDIFSVK